MLNCENCKHFNTDNINSVCERYNNCKYQALLMNKEQWQKELEYEQSNREGLGMYVLDTFNEDIADILSERDSLIRKRFIDSIKYMGEKDGEGNIIINEDVLNQLLSVTNDEIWS